ncbi:hypothetical protein K3495_g8679 [Podosphaera aphanis]|nr:hypothetical protein K3495_g8679 [Podosphaera aphanis]
MRPTEGVEVDDAAAALHEADVDHSAPLVGVVICCTSVSDEKRTALASYAEQMGARHQLDLTRDVTHLIVGAVDTPKYKYVARNRQDIMPMTVEWIEAIRDLWIADQEIDVKAMEQKFLLPTFFSLKFSMTGCDEPAERLGIAELVRANGATYEGDLTKSITHLISFRTEGAKYKAAKSWGLKIISIEWLHQSLERGMMLEEKLFDPTLPIEERGQGAWDRTTPLKTSLGRRARTDSTGNLDHGKRKLRKTANTKLSRQHDRIWADISCGTTGPQVHRSGNWEPESDEMTPRLGPNLKTSTESQREEIQPKVECLPAPKTGIFAGCKFWLHEFSTSKIDILRNHLASNDGEVIDKVQDQIVLPSTDLQEPDLLKFFFIVPHDLPKAKLPRLPPSTPPIAIVTFWWVERCLHHKKFLDPNDHVIGRPFPVFPIPDIVAQKTVICSSAYTGIDLLHLTRAVDLIGATYSDFMTPNATLLLTKSLDAVRKDKLNFAREWNIPIVSAKWLWDSIEAGSYLPTTHYLCQPMKKKYAGPTHQDVPIKAADFQSESLFRGSSESATRATSRRTSSHSTSRVHRDGFSPESTSSKTSNSNGPSTIRTNSKSSSTYLASGIDRDAFSPESIPPKKTVPDAKSEVVSDDPHHSLLPQPDALVERDVNSPLRNNSMGPAPSDKVFSRPSEDITHAISSLLAKTKNTSLNSLHEVTEPRKRSRILGRVTSNTSNQSCATSVDSTATYGTPVQWPSLCSDQTANERIEMLMKGTSIPAAIGLDGSQLSSTQLEYEDPDSTVARELVMARMRGEVIDLTKVRKFERKRTIGDVDEPRASGLRSRRTQ